LGLGAVIDFWGSAPDARSLLAKALQGKRRPAGQSNKPLMFGQQSVEVLVPSAPERSGQPSPRIWDGPHPACL